MPSRSSGDWNRSLPLDLHGETHAAPPAAGLLVAVHAGDGRELGAFARQAHDDLARWRGSTGRGCRIWSAMRIGLPRAGVQLHRIVVGQDVKAGAGLGRCRWRP